MPFEVEYLSSVRKQFNSYKSLGEKAINQLTDPELYHLPEPNSNSIAIIVKHMHGNMKSRFTNFLSEDGEKPWREREKEFTSPVGWHPTGEVRQLWDEGWTTVLLAIDQLAPEQLVQTITIRHEPLLVVDAINRQLAHYASHVGQIIFLAKLIRGKDWISSSIAKGESNNFNQEMARKFRKD